LEQWKIVRDKRHQDGGCCDRPKGAESFAVLELPACVRRDHCPMCFAEMQRRRPPESKPPVFWRIKRKAGRTEAVLDLTLLRHLFDRLGEEVGERPAALRYFVALLLLRKRVLKMVPARTVEQERADLVVVDPKLAEMEPVALFAPSVDSTDLGAIKDELLLAIGETAQATDES
jgi:hypothetical protein